MKRLRFYFAAALALLAVPNAPGAVTLRTAPCEGVSQTYLLATPPGHRPTPAILLLHGAGGHAQDLLIPWQSFAETHDVVLIAPELTNQRSFEPIAPAVFRCVVEDARRVAPVDPKRIFIVGNSMGGYLAYDAAMFQSEYFAAIAVHAAAIDSDYEGIVKEATRQIPIAIFIGDEDPLVPLAPVRRTRDLLRQAGFPVEYEEIPGHDHHYEQVADKLNREAWRFFEAHPLP